MEGNSCLETIVLQASGPSVSQRAGRLFSLFPEEMRTCQGILMAEPGWASRVLGITRFLEHLLSKGAQGSSHRRLGGKKRKGQASLGAGWWRGTKGGWVGWFGVWFLTT